MTRRILISVGEVSGDQHAASLVPALRSRFGVAEFRAMGGRHLKQAGVEVVVDSEESLGVMGFGEVFARSRGILQALGRMERELKEWQPDILILVDFADFNLRLAKQAKRLGIPVLYFIPPKVWAWRRARVRKIRKRVTHAATIFPFERDFLLEHGVSASYVGHPFHSREWSAPKKEDFLREHQIPSGVPLLALLPGSRRGEVTRILPRLVDAFRVLCAKHPHVHAIIPVAPGIAREHIERVVAGEKNMHVLEGESAQILKLADAGILKSGTCNLEAAYVNLPFAMCYVAPPVTAAVLKRVLPIQTFSIVNHVRPETVREILQEQATPQALAAEMERLLFDEGVRQQQRAAFAEVRSKLASADEDTRFARCETVQERVAALAEDFIRKRDAQTEVSLPRIGRYLKPHRVQFIGAVLCTVLFGLSDGVVPLLVQQSLDGVFAHQNKEMLLLLPLLVIAFAIVRALADFGQEYLMARTGHGIIRDIRNDLHGHIQRLSLDYFSRRSMADILSRFTSDVVLVRSLLTEALASLFRDSVRIIALLAVAISLDPFLALIAFVVFPIGILPVYWFGRRLRRLAKRGQDEVGWLSSLVQETTMGARVVRIFGREGFEVDRFKKRNQELFTTFLRSERYRALSGPVNEVLASFAIAGIILYGGYSVIGGLRTQGEFIAFLIAVFLLYEPFKKLSRVNNAIQQGMAGAQRIFEVLDSEPSVSEPAPNEVRHLGSANDIELRAVSVQYPGARMSALKNVSLHIQHGEKVALVGFSGAGKSTLVDVIPRFVDPSMGEVRIGGVPIRQVPLRELRERITMVGQHTFLFHDTILSNIGYGNAKASREDIIAAARAAYAYDFIEALPNGFDTVVGENGFTLSGGERQRIAIARALLKDAPILILDEATASLDNRSEREVQAALEALQANRTTIVIAHRLSTVQHADRIVVLHEGEIIEIGPHAELLQRGGTYARLYALQFQEAPPTEPTVVV